MLYGLIKGRRLWRDFPSARQLSTACLWIVLLGWSAMPLRAAVHYVTPTGDAGGLSPVYSSIQAAIDAAAQGDEIRVAQGVYDQVTSVSGTRQVARMDKSLVLRGGYSPDFAQWSPATFTTTIDGKTEGRGILIFDELKSPNYQGTGAGNLEVVVSGMRVIRGNGAAGGGAPGTVYGGGMPNTGGGISVQSASLILMDCELTSNTAFQSGQTTQTQWSAGGGLGAYYSSVTIARCRFAGNDGGQGGGLCQGGAIFAQGYMANLRVENSEFVANTIEGDGSAIYASQGNVYLRGNSFRSNRALQRGTICVEHLYREWPGGTVPLTIRENQFIDNTAGRGGALHLDAQAARVFRNLFRGNQSTGEGGGALSLVQSNYDSYPTTDSEGLTVDNNVFLDNVWTGLNEAGTRRGGDAILLAPADMANPVYYYPGQTGSTVEIRHNTFGRPPGAGGTAAVNLVWRKARLVNNAIVNHSVGVRVRAIGSSSTPPYVSEFWLDHTLFSGNGQNVQIADGTVTETQTIDAASPGLDADGYHLLAGSPALDAGAPTSVNIDYDANYRPSGNAPDIGADETPLAHEVPPQIVRLLLAARAPHVYRETQEGGGVIYRLLQETIAVIANDMTSDSLETYTLRQQLDPILTPDHQFSWPAMTYQPNGSQLSWHSLTPLPSQDRAQVRVLASATDWSPGDTLVSSATLTYTPTGGAEQTLAAGTTTSLPFVIPIITSPGNGEIMPPLPGEAGIAVRGQAKPGSTIRLYENDQESTQTVTGANGVFEGWFRPNNLLAGQTVLTARDVTIAGRPSPPSNPVALARPMHPWCPQRSYWELHYNLRGQTRTFIYHFRNGRGEFSTQDWTLPRLGGPVESGTLHLYAYCLEANAVPTSVGLTIGDAGYEPTQTSTEPPVYQFATGAMTAGQWVKIKVMCGATLDVSIGRVPPVLIDPDGYVFNASLGFDPAQPTAHALSGAAVTCMQWVAERGGWVPWPADLYDNQINPQTTGSDGYFAFFTPPGLYCLQAAGPMGFQPWRSPAIEVISEVVHQNIPLTPTPIETAATIDLSPGRTGPLPAITIKQGQAVEWVSSAKGLSAVALAGYAENPVVRVQSENDSNTPLGWDGGMQSPGETYRRAFMTTGLYAYTDGLGGSGSVNVLPANSTPGASDYQFSVIDNAMASWRLTSVSSPGVFSGPLTTDNPTITLIVGKRYAVTDTVFTIHPFQVIAKGSDSLSDVILLSLGSVAGSFEPDPDVNWIDDGAGLVEFTLTPALASAMNAGDKTAGYRCSAHPDIMRGDFLIVYEDMNSADRAWLLCP